MNLSLNLLAKPALVGVISAVGAAYILGQPNEKFPFPLIGSKLQENFSLWKNKLKWVESVIITLHKRRWDVR